MARKKVDQSRTEAEIRAVFRKLSHHPDADIIRYLRESRNISADPDFIKELRRGA